LTYLTVSTHDQTCKLGGKVPN